MQDTETDLQSINTKELEQKLLTVKSEISQGKSQLRALHRLEPVWFDLQMLRNRVASLTEANAQCPDLVPESRLSEVREQLNQRKMELATLSKQHPQLRLVADVQVKMTRIEQSLQSLKMEKEKLRIELGLRRLQGQQQQPQSRRQKR